MHVMRSSAVVARKEVVLRQNMREIAADVIGAAKGGDTAELADAQARWEKNADDIARAVNSVTPRAPGRCVFGARSKKPPRGGTNETCELRRQTNERPATSFAGGASSSRPRGSRSGSLHGSPRTLATTCTR